MSRPIPNCDTLPIRFGACGCGCDGPICHAGSEFIGYDNLDMELEGTQVLTVQGRYAVAPCSGDYFYWTCELGTIENTTEGLSTANEDSVWGLSVTYTAPITGDSDTVYLHCKHPEHPDAWEGCECDSIVIILLGCVCTGNEVIQSDDVPGSMQVQVGDVLDLYIDGKHSTSPCTDDYTWDLNSAEYANYDGDATGDTAVLNAGEQGDGYIVITLNCKGDIVSSQIIEVIDCCTCIEEIDPSSATVGTEVTGVLQLTNKYNELWPDTGYYCDKDGVDTYHHYTWQITNYPAGSDCYLEDANGNQSTPGGTNSTLQGTGMYFYSGTVDGMVEVQVTCGECPSPLSTAQIVVESGTSCECAGDIDYSGVTLHNAFFNPDELMTINGEDREALILDVARNDGYADGFSVKNRGVSPCPTTDFSWAIALFLPDVDFDPQDDCPTKISGGTSETIQGVDYTVGTISLLCGGYEIDVYPVAVRDCCSGIYAISGPSSVPVEGTVQLDALVHGVDGDPPDNQKFPTCPSNDFWWDIADGAPTGCGIITDTDGYGAQFTAGTEEGSATIELKCNRDNYTVRATHEISITACYCDDALIGCDTHEITEEIYRSMVMDMTLVHVDFHVDNACPDRTYDWVISEFWGGWVTTTPAIGYPLCDSGDRYSVSDSTQIQFCPVQHTVETSHDLSLYCDGNWVDSVIIFCKEFLDCCLVSISPVTTNVNAGGSYDYSLYAHSVLGSPCSGGQGVTYYGWLITKLDSIVGDADFLWSTDHYQCIGCLDVIVAISSDAEVGAQFALGLYCSSDGSGTGWRLVYELTLTVSEQGPGEGTILYSDLHMTACACNSVFLSDPNYHHGCDWTQTSQTFTTDGPESYYDWTLESNFDSSKVYFNGAHEGVGSVEVVFDSCPEEPYGESDTGVATLRLFNAGTTTQCDAVEIKLNARREPSNGLCGGVENNWLEDLGMPYWPCVVKPGTKWAIYNSTYYACYADMWDCFGDYMGEWPLFFVSRSKCDGYLGGMSQCGDAFCGNAIPTGERFNSPYCPSCQPSVACMHPGYYYYNDTDPDRPIACPPYPTTYGYDNERIFVGDWDFDTRCWEVDGDDDNMNGRVNTYWPGFYPAYPQCVWEDE